MVQRIAFVCTGNICRSPTAEVVLRSMAPGLEVESFGLGDYHVGDGADRRTLQAMSARGYDGSSHRARQFSRRDFDRFDLVLAMDSGHLADLRRLAPDDAARGKVRLFGSYSESDAGDPDVPDPYYGGPQGFHDVLDRIERASRGLLAALRPAATEP